ncbi:MAG: hypothetical protein WCO89_13375, partial [Syntrophus sp. (in: bacteria)]
MPGVWIFAERKDLAQELLTIGRELAALAGVKVTAIVPDQGDQEDIYIAGGADEVVLLSPLGEDMSLDSWIPVIAAEAKKADPDLIL